MDSWDCIQVLSFGSRYFYALSHLAKALQGILSENKAKVSGSVTDDIRGSVKLQVLRDFVCQIMKNQSLISSGHSQDRVFVSSFCFHLLAIFWAHSLSLPNENFKLLVFQRPSCEFQGDISTALSRLTSFSLTPLETRHFPRRETIYTQERSSQVSMTTK